MIKFFLSVAEWLSNVLSFIHPGVEFRLNQWMRNAFFFFVELWWLIRNVVWSELLTLIVMTSRKKINGKNNYKFDNLFYSGNLRAAYILLTKLYQLNIQFILTTLLMTSTWRCGVLFFNWVLRPRQFWFLK